MNMTVINGRAALALEADSRLRLGMLGAGRAARECMTALSRTDFLEISAIGETEPARAQAALALAPEAERTLDLSGLLARELDAVVIGSNSVSNAEHSLLALARFLPVFCLRPIGRCADEVQAVVDAARSLDRCLQVDFAYRDNDRAAGLRQQFRQGSLGAVNRIRIDAHLATPLEDAEARHVRLAEFWHHLIDLPLWLLDHPAVTSLTVGEPSPERIEVQMELEGGVRLDIVSHIHQSREEGEFLSLALGTSREDQRLCLSRGRINALLGILPPGAAWPQTLPPAQAATRWARRLLLEQGFIGESEMMISVAKLVDQVIGPR
ncbi:Gfo/Idh/MocA family protein [Rhizobium paknamense]|uniref:Dehydrogenase n=1 Tax=Rhizobium paknamense TaxID=1206817 RepID=A0ABU0IBI2_9HYPH|nr:Gfo/Idh/MocA family oxidoreductase [Rhizobium paknamense]MDQ0455581.1 putative dehydrogenase [Rhizobium paknamense]